MSFDDRDVRRGMDVFTLDNELVGTVVWIRRGPPRQALLGREIDAAVQVSAPGGESLGPVPTANVGNRGPLTQGALARFGSRADRAARGLNGGELFVLRTPVGPEYRHRLPRLRRIPLAAVQTVSLERIVLRVTAAELEAGRA